MLFISISPIHSWTVFLVAVEYFQEESLCMLNIESPLECVKSEGGEHDEKKWRSFAFSSSAQSLAAQPNAHSGTAKNIKIAQSRIRAIVRIKTEMPLFLRYRPELRCLAAFQMGVRLVEYFSMAQSRHAVVSGRSLPEVPHAHFVRP
jgi:hypothetical protein